ncbi:MAG: hypothetical protein WC273_10725 [Dehalococcoidia bacterium]
MQAIQTKYHGPTNSTGSRITARCDAGRLTVPYDYALNIDGNHRAAAEALLVKVGWDNLHSLASGTLHDGSGAHVLIDRA